ncbi:hypothetical protein DRJ19_01640 [Candidatus Woesearchaeota archaeon]|nr:MAG: hypothetical protein DRJ19_01640 [Candidatus Woesearchaeota archaeon]
MVKMRMHFAASDVHQNGKGIACTYCNSCLEGADDIAIESHFEKGFHYKLIRCKGCGRLLTKRVDFCGSGHDNFCLEEMLK